MPVTIQRATKKNLKLRMALDGPSGSGKTFTALIFAFALAGKDGKVLVIDTEHRSASKYADQFPPFDVIELESYSPLLYLEGLKLAEDNGYSVLVIDSLSHAWEGAGGVLEMHDQASKRSGNSYTAWKDVTPVQTRFMEDLLASNLHLIVTMRSKMAYVQTEDERTHKQTVKKLGMEPIQRQGSEYLFDVVADIDIDHNLMVSKTRCSAVADQVVSKPTGAWLAPVIAWLDSGAPVPPPAPKPAQAATTQPTTTAGAATTTSAPAATKPTRPFTAEQLKAKYADACAKCADTPTADGYRGIIAASLDLCFAGQADSTPKVHSLVKYLSGKDSRNDLTPRELRAFGSWLRQTQDSGGALQIDAMAGKEAQIVITQVMTDAGQQTLPLEENEDQAPKDTEPGEEEIPF